MHPRSREKNMKTGPCATAVSVIIPVLNEAACINEAIARIRELDGGKNAEVIVVDGSPDRETISAVSDPGVVIACSPAGRGRQMNRGAELASGAVLLFLHVDTALPLDALARVRSLLEDATIVAGAFSLGIASGRKIYRVTERYVGLRTRLTRVPFGDQAIFIRRGYFEAIGGYRNIPLMQDVELMTRIRKRGDRIGIIREKVMTSPRRWEREGIFSCTFRNWALQLSYSLGVSPERLARWYRSS